VDKEHITSSSSYLHHNGKTVQFRMWHVFFMASKCICINRPSCFKNLWNWIQSGVFPWIISWAHFTPGALNTDLDLSNVSPSNTL
jgi:hypothetical protein